MSNFIDAKNYSMKRYMLWQVADYQYQITTSQNHVTGEFPVVKTLPMSYQQACEAFKAFRGV